LHLHQLLWEHLELRTSLLKLKLNLIYKLLVVMLPSKYLLLQRGLLLYGTCKTPLQNLGAQLTLRELLILIWSIMLILIISYKTIKLTAKLWLIRKLANHFLLAMLLHILIFLRILLLHTNHLCTLVSLFILYYNIFPLLICLLIGINKTYQTL
jgi:hypothetical protein